jgi:pimeloyl-ACP methyl ester carboxylesterase
MNWDKVLTMTFPEFQYAFTNTFPDEQQKTCYDRSVAPVSGRLFFQAAFAQLDPHHALQVNRENPNRAPLLLIAGELDHLVPAPVVKTNYEHHKRSTAPVDFHELPGRAHLLTSQDGWEQIADYANTWLEQLPAK